MAAVIICSDFGGQENKVCHCFYCFPIYLPWSDGTGCHDLGFLNVEFLSQLFHPPLSLLKGSLDPLHFLPLEWYHLHIWDCWYFSRQPWFQLVIHPSLAFWIMCSVYKLNKQSDQIQCWHTPFPNWNQSIVPFCSMSVLTVVSWPTYRFLRKQIRWSGISISLKIFHSLLWST